jgi:alkylation response protein AidB-like acyl-CoA dehydrogenase
MTKTYQTDLNNIIEQVISPLAQKVDETGAFPREALDAMGEAGLLGLVSSSEVGGSGESHRAAAFVVERVANACGSTAMVVCMHYAGAAVIEAFGDREKREAIAKGKHVTTLAFSEYGSRSHFWAPMGTATRKNGGISLNAKKSWVTSAGQSDSYVWSSRPLAADGNSTLWLVPANAEGLSIPKPFDGLGLRGNHSSPVLAEGVVIESKDMLGSDGEGFDLMMKIVLPYFSVMSAAFSVGTMRAMTDKSIKHSAQTELQHLGNSLSNLPTVRAYLARMQIKTDMAHSLLADALDSLEKGRDDAMLRVLEIKAATGELVTEVTDLGMRVCGGAAFRKDSGLERHFRDARASTVMAPTTDMLYDFIGRAICGIPLFE